MNTLSYRMEQDGVLLAQSDTQTHQSIGLYFKIRTDGDERICIVIIQQHSNMCAPWGRGIPPLEDKWVSGPTCMMWSSLHFCTETPRGLNLVKHSLLYTVLTSVGGGGGVPYVTVTQPQSSTSTGVSMSNLFHSLWYEGESFIEESDGCNFLEIKKWILCLG